MITPQDKFEVENLIEQERRKAVYEADNARLATPEKHPVATYIEGALGELIVARQRIAGLDIDLMNLTDENTMLKAKLAELEVNIAKTREILEQTKLHGSVHTVFDRIGQALHALK